MNTEAQRPFSTRLTRPLLMRSLPQNPLHVQMQTMRVTRLAPGLTGVVACVTAYCGWHAAPRATSSPNPRICDVALSGERVSIDVITLRGGHTKLGWVLVTEREMPREDRDPRGKPTSQRGHRRGKAGLQTPGAGIGRKGPPLEHPRERSPARTCVVSGLQSRGGLCVCLERHRLCAC